MSEHDSKKVPITDREYLWVKNVDTGEVALHVGPTLFQPSAADRFVCDDGKGGYADDPAAKPRKMIEVADGQYAVIFNPCAEPQNEPNGPFEKGKNPTMRLLNGTKSMVPGPCAFYLRPGQRTEVRDAHRLEANEYVVVEVQGNVDEASPYYSITAESAKIKTAINADERTDEESEQVAAQPTEQLRLGQRIVITGLKTNYYIPPSGVDLVPDTSVDASGKKLTPDVARRLLKSMKKRALAAPSSDELYASYSADQPTWANQAPGSPNYEMVESYLNEFAETGGTTKGLAPSSVARFADSNALDQSTRGRHMVRSKKQIATMGDDVEEVGQEALRQEQRRDVARRNLEEVMQTNEAFQEAVQKEARKAALVRRAVVLSEKEFCVLIDEDGKRQVKKGPARVFPGPYDRFQTEGSRNRVYDAYELLPQRALWLRVITPISQIELSKSLPVGTKLDKENYYPGDEILVHGISAFFFPFNEVEVLDAKGQAVVGNDHSSVLIEEIGIDQKSGIYVRDLRTGEVKLVRGKTSYLVDPRYEVQIFRIVPADDWNLMIGEQEPHKRTRQEVRTPWALSITIPHNMAVLATSAEGQRVIEGPCVELLEYEEKLAVLKLSKGRPKDARDSLKTCFLRVRGNRVSDEVTVETADFIKIRFVLSYTITFLEDYKSMWFNHMNYVQLLANQLRSLLRGNLRKIDFLTLWPKLEDEVRDIVLGTKGSEDGERKGRTFDLDNGMHIMQVDVIESECMDHRIAEKMREVQASSVALSIGDREAKDKLNSDKLRAGIADETREIAAEQYRKNAEDQEQRFHIEHEATLDSIAKTHLELQEKSAKERDREKSRVEAEIERERIVHEANNATAIARAQASAQASETLHQEEQAHATVMSNLEMQMINAQSQATVAERQAVQPGLIEALSGWSEAHLAGKAAENMGLISLIKGEDAMTLLTKFFGASRPAQLLKKLSDKYASALPESLHGGNGDESDMSRHRR